MEFDEWLGGEGLSSLAEVFAANHIDEVEILADFNDAELEAIGIPIGSRKKIRRALARLGYEVENTQALTPPAAPPAAETPPEPASLPPVKQPAWPDEIEPQEAPPSFSEAPVQPAASPDQAHTAPLQAQASQTQATRHEPKAKNSRKATAIMIAVGVHVAIIVLATTLTIFAASKDEPEIIAVIAPPVATPQQEMKKKTVQKQVKRAPSSASAAAAPMAIMMKANAEARFTTPEVTRTSTGPLGAGEGDLGSGAFGIGTGLGEGTGGGASFFGGSAKGNRFLFVLDHSNSMKQEVELRNQELEKTLASLNSSMQYQVVLFSGLAYYAQKGWTVRGQEREVTDPEGKIYDIRKIKFSTPEDATKEFDVPQAQWLQAIPENKKATMEFVRNEALTPGTNWLIAFLVGHHIQPTPDVIFFMADGTGNNDPPPILALNQLKGKPVINTVAMKTSEGAEEFATLARATNGKFTIVDKQGRPIDGFDFLKDPNKYKDRVK